MERVIRKVLESLRTDRAFSPDYAQRISADALRVLQVAGETALLGVCRESQELALHSNRIIVKGEDVRFAARNFFKNGSSDAEYSPIVRKSVV